MRDGIVAGLDLGGTHVSAALAGATGAIVARGDEPVDRHAGPAPIIEQMVALVRRLLTTSAATAGAPARLLAMGIGCPGIIDAGRGVVLGAANLDGWRRVSVRDALGQALGVPVRLENDVNLGALGEGWRGAARGMRDYAFVALGTGVGGGVVANGQLVRGAHGYGGEVGYLVAEPGLAGPAFQGRGNLEALAGTPGLQRLAAERGIDGEPEALFAAAAAGDVAAQELVRATVHRLAVAIADITAVVDPEAVIIGGGLSRQGDALLGPLRELVAQIAGPPVRVLPAALGTDAQLHGALFAALEHAGLYPPEVTTPPMAADGRR